MEDNVHQHCENCFNFNCSVSKKCKMVFCHVGCGARFHECKNDDHVFVCPKEVVSCPNAVFGCPMKIQRARINKHLVVCPASIVFCTMEWNRYPLYSKSRLSWVPFFQPNPVLVKGHLDVELALRDQQVLQDMFKKRLRKGKAKVDILRSNPEGKDTKDQDKNPRHVNSTQVDMAVALSTLEHKLKPLKFRTEEPDGNCIVVIPKRKSKESETKPRLLKKEFQSETQSDHDQHVGSLCENTSLPAQIPSNQGSKPAENQLRLTDQEFESGAKSATTNNNTTAKPSLEDGGVTRMGEKWHQYLENNSDMKNQQPTVQVNELNPTKLSEPSLSDPGIPCAPTFEDIYLVEPLGLNVMLETLPKFQKQAPLYSIPCNQVFRRDEYGAHFKNIHSEIHGGLNGWVEHRCPLAQYGCTFVHHRLLPNDQCGRVTFNKELGSFGVRHCMTNRKGNLGDDTEKCIHDYRSEETGKDYLSNLPMEILEKITRMLDGFSLCHFSQTSKLLRLVSQQVLESKGLVVLEWEKRIYDNGSWSWQVRQKKWFFSTSFTLVKNWVHSDKPGMASHLETCPFFDRYIPAAKFCYQAVDNDVDNNYQYNYEDDNQSGIDIDKHWQELRDIAAMY